MKHFSSFFFCFAMINNESFIALYITFRLNSTWASPAVYLCSCFTYLSAQMAGKVCVTKKKEERNSNVTISLIQERFLWTLPSYYFLYLFFYLAFSIPINVNTSIVVYRNHQKIKYSIAEYRKTTPMIDVLNGVLIKFVHYYKLLYLLNCNC